MGLIITVPGCYLSDENETNKYAQQAIELEEAVYMEHNDYTQSDKKLHFGQVLITKLRIIWQNLK